MKPVFHRLLVLLPVALLTVSLSAFAEKSPKPPKPAKVVSHLFSQTSMQNEGVIATASGRVDLHENGQSKGNAEDLHIEVRSLETNTAYQLAALVADDTNLTQVAEFTTDEHGNANLEFRSKNPGKGKGDGKNKHPLPSALDPVSNIRELTVLDGDGQAILTADLTNPSKFEYFLKSDAGGGSKSDLQIKADTHKSQVRLNASGLAANSDYSLALNGSVASTTTTDAKGKLKIGAELSNPADVLALQTVSLLDSSGTEVLSVSLP